jgi:hypothetical protein
VCLLVAFRQAASPVVCVTNLVGRFRVAFLCGGQIPLDGLHAVAFDPEAQVIQLAERIHVLG